MGSQPHDFIPRSGQNPTGPSGDFIPRTSPQSQRMQPTHMRMGAPTYDNRTMTAQRYKRRPPMWVVAALSCSIALLIAGVVIAIVSSTSSSSSTTPPTPKAAGSSTAAGAGAAAAGAASGAAGSGPFSSARAAFNGVVAQPGSSITPPQTGAPSGAVTAPPVMTAAADPAPPPVATPTPAVAAATQPVVAPAAAAPPAATTATTAKASTGPIIAPVAPPSTPAAAPTTSAKKPAALGALTVVCMPKCDQIIDNGASLGPGHIFNRPVPAGRHVLQLSAPNGARKNLVVEVAPEQTKEVRMTMEK
jgi:hypothetical protein